MVLSNEKINELIEIVSLTQPEKKFFVKSIIDLSWNEFGDLIVEIEGYYL